MRCKSHYNRMQVNAPEQIESPYNMSLSPLVVSGTDLQSRSWSNARPSFTFYLYLSRQRKPRFDILDCAQKIRNGCPVKDINSQLSAVNAPLHGSAMWSRASVGRRDKFVW
jgi:hypothetical protein